jgi:hypothetical protein
MIRVQFTAARDLAGTHADGDPVTLSFSASELSPGREIVRDVQKSLSGKTETLLHNTLRTWSVTTGPLDGVALDAMLEFLASTEGGESFAFEPWRYETGPSLDLDFTVPRLRIAEATTVQMTTEGYTLSRLIGVGTGGADDYYSVNFAVKEAP